MPITSGKGRLLNGSGGDRVKRNNLMELRGSSWEMVTDWFFGHTGADVDWSNVADEDRWTKWILSTNIPVDGPQESDLVIQTDTNHGRVEHIAGNGVATSNLRELWILPESNTWGIAHAATEIKSSDMWGITEDGLTLNSQHGLALRCQQDKKRRGIICWHDATFGIPYIINIGVWDCNLDDSGFHNHQTNMWWSHIPETYIPTGAIRQGGNAIVTFTSHGYQVGDVVQCQFQLTPAQTSIVVNRASNFVTADVGTHSYVVGDQVSVTAGSPSSFNGGLFYITSVVANVSITWAQTGTNVGGTATVTANHRVNGQLTEVTATTVTLPDTGNDRTYPVNASAFVSRIFPYYLEARVEGLIVSLKAWGRHEAYPAWDDQNRVMTVNLTAATQSGIAFTNATRTANVATVTLGAHNFVNGERINTIVCAGDTTFQEAGSPFGGGCAVHSVTTTTISYNNPGTDVAPTGPSGTLRRTGSGSISDIRDHPAPVGTGSIGFVAAHTGTDDRSACVYGPFTGTNSFFDIITSMSQLPALEVETAQPMARIKTEQVGQVTETETAGALSKGIRFTPTAIYSRVTTGLALPVTVAAWVKMRDIPATYRNLFYHGSNSESNCLGWWWNSAGNLSIQDGGFTDKAVIPGLDLDEWYYVACTVDTGTDNMKVYYRAEGEAALTVITPATWAGTFANNLMGWGGTHAAGEVLTHLGDIAFPRMWASVLTAGQLQTESEAPLAVVSAWGDWAPDGTDLSGNARTLTQDLGTGTITGADGPRLGVFATDTVADQAIESEVALPIVAVKTRAVTQAIEEEVAQPATVVRVRTLAQAAETELATLSGRLKALVVSQAAESELSTATTRIKSKVLTQALETETATNTGRLKTRIAAQVLETETATVVTSSKLRAVSQATESEVAQAVARLKALIAAQAAESELAQTIAVLTPEVVAQAVETEIAQPIRAIKVRALAQVVESEAAQSVVAVRSHIVAQVVEVETAGATATRKLRALIQAVETETALIVVAPGVVRQALETEIAQPITRLKTRVVAQAVETEMVTAVARLKTRLLNQGIEAEIARLFTTPGIVRQAIETEQAMPITALKRKAIAQVVEAEAAQAFAHAKGHVLGMAQELETAQPWSHSKLMLVLQVIETESGLIIVRPTDQPPSGVITGVGGGAQRRTSSRHGASRMVSSGKVTVL